ncbi:type II toxin-antitoxin system HicB family antitoxin [Lactobacillus reuteri]|uniref:type II toxin-antitoxin system HicB family antitoxin n=1 Tax=Limosilactobacillus reuteri TaxID=1598 RepID=UPI00128E2DEB|nr:type II toxin-antitoxin system HicB family antitoxin [Limosilactobacillus reuteri]MQB58346.1 type II toxin-antitoxin system HicB family antitoxin [Limosilactobacillus reuteri]MQB78583.1 type II toxin-antitoxin system HicB family antitoxin [Limosilactobacillus reuteri]MQB82489.1 type II toxin-antitoxin system HicB family antitoxin [Limosilactobacillus reuteri]MQB84110.1 type II toxin-antitoxin system HicB family antitoxin [Limosilactobacillus reuteri]MQB88485.1 type II toxin-antitoxin system
MDDIKVFPIIITKDDNSDCPYFVEIPDIDGMTEGKSIADAMEMAKDYIGTYSLEDKLPESNTKLPQAKDGATVTLVTINVSEYKRKHDNKVIKKTITIPNYLNELGKENGINFSEVMTTALKEKLSV